MGKRQLLFLGTGFHPGDTMATMPGWFKRDYFSKFLPAQESRWIPNGLKSAGLDRQLAWLFADHQAEGQPIEAVIMDGDYNKRFGYSDALRDMAGMDAIIVDAPMLVAIWLNETERGTYQGSLMETGADFGLRYLMEAANYRALDDIINRKRGKYEFFWNPDLWRQRGHFIVPAEQFRILNLGYNEGLQCVLELYAEGNDKRWEVVRYADARLGLDVDLCDLSDSGICTEVTHALLSMKPGYDLVIIDGQVDHDMGLAGAMRAQGHTTPFFAHPGYSFYIGDRLGTSEECLARSGADFGSYEAHTDICTMVDDVLHGRRGQHTLNPQLWREQEGVIVQAGGVHEQ